MIRGFIQEGDSRIIMLNTNPQSAVFYLCKVRSCMHVHPSHVLLCAKWSVCMRCFQTVTIRFPMNTYRDCELMMMQMYINIIVTSLWLDCVQAFREQRFNPAYVWISPGWYQQGWWKADESYLDSLNCTISDIEQQLNRSLVLLAHPNSVSIIMGSVVIFAAQYNNLKHYFFFESIFTAFRS